MTVLAVLLPVTVAAPWEEAPSAVTVAASWAGAAIAVAQKADLLPETLAVSWAEGTLAALVGHRLAMVAASWEAAQTSAAVSWAAATLAVATSAARMRAPLLLALLLQTPWALLKRGHLGQAGLSALMLEPPQLRWVRKASLPRQMFLGPYPRWAWAIFPWGPSVRVELPEPASAPMGSLVLAWAAGQSPGALAHSAI